MLFFEKNSEIIVILCIPRPRGPRSGVKILKAGAPGAGGFMFPISPGAPGSGDFSNARNLRSLVTWQGNLSLFKEFPPSTFCHHDIFTLQRESEPNPSTQNTNSTIDVLVQPYNYEKWRKTFIFKKIKLPIF